MTKSIRTRRQPWAIATVLAAVLVLAFSSVSSAAEEADDESAAAPAHAASSGIGGPSSVGGTLSRDAEVEPTELVRYFDFKDRLKKQHGLSFGIDYFALYQSASSSPGEDHAASGAFRLFGTWALVNRGSANTGSLVAKIENRHRLGTDIAPQDLGFEVGYVGLTAVPFSGIEWALTNLYWEQTLADGRFAFVAGYVDPTDYVDVYALVDPWNDYSNLAYTTNPTIPIPNQGLGAALRFTFGDHWYLLGGIADANSDPTEPGDAWSSFFDTSEFFTHLEVGWISSFGNRYTDNIHLTLWHADERETADVPGGWGASVSWSQTFSKRWMPFVRAGYADSGGPLWERSVSTGTGYTFRNGQDQLGIGLSWGRPSAESFGDDLSDQVTFEAFYRWRLLRILQLTPAVQFLFDPALNPEKDMITVVGLRARLTL